MVLLRAGIGIVCCDISYTIRYGQLWIMLKTTMTEQIKLNFLVRWARSDDLDTWKQGRIPWATAPANIDDAGILDTEFARRLGEFSVPRGRHNAEYRFKSEDLLSLIQKDKNQFLTLAIVCEDFHAGSDFVYSMIGRQEKRGKAPSLNFAFWKWAREIVVCIPVRWPFI